jgi:FtsP/CotA-like multicopper oxidase with cupredoxin domain
MSSDLPRADRRKFLKGAALTGAAALTPAAAAKTHAAPPRTDLKAAAPGPKLVAAETRPRHRQFRDRHGDYRPARRLRHGGARLRRAR